jgi:YfiR/HmsC-like
MMSIHQRKDYSWKSNWVWCVTGSGRIWRAFTFIFACCLFLNASPQALSQNDRSAEYTVKLAFLYSITKFVDWPSDSYRDPGASFALCIVGADPFGRNIEEELQTRTVEGHSIQVKTVRSDDTLSSCHMIFIPVTEEGQAARIVRGLKGSSTLTVGETEGFATLGGIINLTVESSRLHFEVNLLGAERARLKISAKMLALAKIVHNEEPWATEMPAARI